MACGCKKKNQTSVNSQSNNISTTSNQENLVNQIVDKLNQTSNNS